MKSIDRPISQKQAHVISAQANFISATILNRINVFIGLKNTERKRLAKHCHCHRYDVGQRIISAGERRNDVFFVITGHVQVIAYTSNGQQVTLQNISAGEMFGEMVAIDSSKHNADVTAHSEALIATMSAYHFREALFRYPSVAEVTLKMLAQTARQFSMRILQMSSAPCRNRLQAELLRLAEPLCFDTNKALISPAPKHNDMASYTGMRRETVTREMSKLRQAGLLERRGRDLILNDIARLNKSVGDQLNWRESI